MRFTVALNRSSRVWSLLAMIISRSIFGIRASGSRGIEIQISFHGCTRRQERAQLIARRRADTLRGECEFSAAWFLVQATEVIIGKDNVLGRRPSRKLSAVLRLFRPGN